MALIDIEHVVIVILENRSFDHACGWLSLATAGPPMPVDGLKDDTAWQARFANDDIDGRAIHIHPLDPAFQNIADPPHEDVDIHTQITTPTHAGGSPVLGGFVKSYGNASPRPVDRSPVMGYYDKRAVPVFDFFARNFAICDHWFSPLPAGTQPNRLMAMSGESQIHHNVGDPLDFPDQRLVYDWANECLGENSWCSYQWAGLPFFSIMHRWWLLIMAGHNDPDGTGVFRGYDHFKRQWAAGDPVPPIIFIEPKYTDDPTFSFAPPNDDHCPTGISEGQLFLADIYNTIIGNDDLWKSTMFIVTYDEHGGFFDHSPPLPVPSHAGGVNFATTGIRVPAFVVSPYVKPGSFFSDPVDATSILQLLADRFTDGKPHSAAVAARQAYLKPLKTILDNPLSTAKPVPIPASELKSMMRGSPAPAIQQQPSPTAQALNRASIKMASLHPDLVRPR